MAKRIKSFSEIEEEKALAERKAEEDAVDRLWESHERMLAEMKRHLKLLEKAEAVPSL